MTHGDLQTPDSQTPSSSSAPSPSCIRTSASFDMLARLERLERQAARWRWVGLGGASIGVAAAACLLGGFALPAGQSGPAAASAGTAPTPERMTAQAFEVVDAAGKVRARLGLSKEGVPSLELLDVAGVAQASLALGQFERPEDARIREATGGRAANGRPVAPTDEVLNAVLRLGRRDDVAGVEIGAGDRLRVLRLRDGEGDERMELRVGPYVRPDMRADLRAKAAGYDEATLRLKAPNEFLAMELGVEPLSLARPDDRRGSATGTLFEQATPYLTMYGWCEEPVFLLSNWAFDKPSLDLWEYGEGRKAERHLFAVPGADAEETDAAKRTQGDAGGAHD